MGGCLYGEQLFISSCLGSQVSTVGNGNLASPIGPHDTVLPEIQGMQGSACSIHGTSPNPGPSIHTIALLTWHADSFQGLRRGCPRLLDHWHDAASAFAPTSCGAKNSPINYST